MFLLSTLLLILSIAVISESRIQCKNSENKIVDWFVAYKLPKEKVSPDIFIQKGEGFMYITAETAESGWNLANKSINASNTLISNTLEPLYGKERNDDLLWIVYNDETPNKTVTFTLGHTKGVVIANDKEGIWLVHSVPRFPTALSPQFSYPKSGLFYGQSFLCISLISSEVNSIGQQLKYNEPQIYSSNIPTNLKSIYPNLVDVVAKSWITSAPWNHFLEISSTAGVKFHSFAKSGRFHKELYADWVAPTLNVDMMVETWPNGRGRLPSACHNPFKVFNVQSIVLKKCGISFLDHVDHSKWGISVASTQPWICIGDINRMETQEIRGGGTVCVKEESLWRAYKAAVDKIESCPR